MNNCASKGRSWSGCVKAGLGCTPAGGHTSCWLPYLYCLYNHYTNKSRSASARAKVENTQAAIAGNYIASNTLMENESNAFWRIVEEHFGDKEWLDCDNEDLVGMLDVVTALGEEHVYTSDDFQKARPALVSDELLARFVERLNNTFQNTDYEGITNYINLDSLNYYNDAINQCEEEAKASGWSSVAEMYTEDRKSVV